MTDLTPRDDVKKAVSEILKRVDILVKQGELDQAMRELDRAKEIDPRNVYALAFEERIAGLREQVRQNKEAAEAKRIADLLAQKKAEEARRKTDEEQKKKDEEARTIILNRLKAEAEARATKEREQLEQRRKVIQAAAANVKSPVEAVATYKQVLHDVWSDGAATEEEQATLLELRETFSIPMSDHAKLEKEAKYECYLDAFRKAYAGDTVTPKAAKTLKELRLAFNISEEEHLQIEAQLLTRLQKEKKKASILVIDDDEKLLEILASTLDDSGYEVKALATSDEAYAILKHWSPDLILCDINLETSTMGGFTFYEKVQELEHLQDIPFIFLTGLTDEVLVRTGKELGVDDYLTKPISDQNLLATIRGKLKRFKKLKKGKKK